MKKIFAAALIAVSCAAWAGEAVQVRNAVVASTILTKDDAYVNGTVAGGNITITLPASAAWGANQGGRIAIFRTDATANVFTIAAGAGDTVNGAASITVAATSGKLCYSNGLTVWTCQ